MSDFIAQSCPTLCDPMDCSLPDSSVHGTFQAIVLELAISFSSGSSRPRDWTQVSCIVDRCFPRWYRIINSSLDKNPPAHTVNTGSVPGLEDSTCQGATQPVCHNYWAHLLQLLKSMSPRAHALQQEKPLQWEACVPQQTTAPLAATKDWTPQWRPSTAKNKINNK